MAQAVAANVATKRKSELDRFLEAPALPPRAIGRAGGGWTNYDVVVAVCGARGVHAVDAPLYDAVALKYERKIETFAQAFAACLVGRRSLARMDIETLRECCAAFEALQLPESINDAQMASEIGEWFARQAGEREIMIIKADLRNRKIETTVSGVCPKCKLIGVSIVNGKVAPHANGCDGVPAAKAAAVFKPRCVCANEGTCRTCKIADGIVQAFFALRSPAARGIGAPTAAVVSPATASAPRTVVARRPAPVAAAAPPALAKLVAAGDGAMLLDVTVQVARGLVEAFQELRNAAVRTLALELARAQATIATGQVQLDAARAGHAAQVASMRAQAPTAAAALACYLCAKDARLGYVLDGKICCRDCRGAHREAYYASRGQVARPRTPRTFNRGARVASMTVHADAVTVASS